MNYFVKHEINHQVTGLHKNPKALQEYRQILSKTLKHPSCKIAICRPENDSKIIGLLGVKLLRKEDDYDALEETATAELKLFYKMLPQWRNLYEPKKVLSKYGVDKLYDDLGAAVHPDYRGLGINNHICMLSEKLCRDDHIPVTVAWANCLASQKSNENGWETVFEISYEELGELLVVHFENAPPTTKFMVWRA